MLKHTLIALAVTAVCWPVMAWAAPAQPVVTVGDKAPLGRIITLAPSKYDPHRGQSEIFWRLDVAPPEGTTITRASMPGYAPVTIALSDGRCFAVGMNSNGSTLLSAPVSAAPCETKALPQPDILPAPPAPGLAYKGRLWSLHVWEDPVARKTFLYNSRSPFEGPVLTADMPVMAVGGMASPDTPRTEVSLAGYIDGRFTIITVMIVE